MAANRSAHIRLGKYNMNFKANTTRAKQFSTRDPKHKRSIAKIFIKFNNEQNKLPDNVISNFIESGKANSSESVVVVVVTHPMVTITTITTEHAKAILCALMGV